MKHCNTPDRVYERQNLYLPLLGEDGLGEKTPHLSIILMTVDSIPIYSENF